MDTRHLYLRHGYTDHGPRIQLPDGPRTYPCSAPRTNPMLRPRNARAADNPTQREGPVSGN